MSLRGVKNSTWVLSSGNSLSPRLAEAWEFAVLGFGFRGLGSRVLGLGFELGFQA